ncbi:MAG TPA: helix-turn-helix domain-containing protein [bacterium]
MWNDEEIKAEGFGSYLKRQRGLRNISIEEISKATRIKKDYIEAIENENFSLLPSATYLSGFVRNYSRYIGIDSEDALLRLESYLRALEGNEKKKGKENGQKNNKDKLSFKKPELVYIITGITVLVLLIILLVLNKKGEEKKLITAIGEPKSEIKTEVKEPSQKPELKEEELVLKVEAIQKTWIMVRLDNAKPFDVLLWDGNTVTWKAKSRISLRIGNPQGVYISLNGVPLKNLGQKSGVIGLVLPDEFNEYK